jgi:hypothetical protein
MPHREAQPAGGVPVLADCLLRPAGFLLRPMDFLRVSAGKFGGTIPGGLVATHDGAATAQKHGGPMPCRVLAWCSIGDRADGFSGQTKSPCHITHSQQNHDMPRLGYWLAPAHANGSGILCPE